MRQNESSHEILQPTDEEIRQLLALPTLRYSGDLNELLAIKANIKECYRSSTGDRRDLLKKVFEHLAVVARNGVTLIVK